MENINKKIILAALTLCFFLLSFILFHNDLINYLIISVTITVILFIYLCCVVFIKKKNKSTYTKDLNKVLKTYDSILLEVEALPKVTDKKIVRTKYFKDLVNVQFELRKPIYYLKDALFCEFLVCDDEQAYIFTLKKDEEYISKTEEVLGEKEYTNQEELQKEVNGEEDNKKYFLNDDERKDIIYNIVLDDDVKEVEEKKEVITANQIRNSFEEERQITNQQPDEPEIIDIDDKN